MLRNKIRRQTLLALSIASLSSLVMALPVEPLQRVDDDRAAPIREALSSETRRNSSRSRLNANQIAPVVDGRLTFTSKESLGATIKELKALDRGALEAKFLRLYQDGFRSNAPIYSETSTEYQAEFEEKIAQRTGLQKKTINDEPMDPDDSDPIIGDDIFSALLNENREIAVGGLIYHYNKQGIFSSKPSEVSTLYAYLESIPEDEQPGMFSSKRSSGAACRSGYAAETVSNGVIHYVPRSCAHSKRAERPAPRLDYADITPIEREPCGASTPGDRLPLRNVSARRLKAPDVNCTPQTYYPPSAGSGSGANSDLDTAQEYLDTLGYCNEKNGTIPLFGTIKKCISKFSKKHRVKTRFWDQDYFVYKSIGISVKNQKRKGVWWTRSTDEIRLGINSIAFEYRLPVPDYQSMAPITYAYRDRVYSEHGSYVGDFNFNGSPTANVPFTSTDIDTVEVFIDLPQFINDIPGIIGIDASIDDLTVDIFSHESVNKRIMSEIWGQAKRIGRDVSGSDIKKVVITGISENKVLVNHMNDTYIKKNAKKIKQVFDYQVGFKLLIRFGGGSGASFNPEWNYDFYDYENLRVDVYGLARSGSTWRGSKLMFEE